MLCRVFGRCLHGGELDRDLGDLHLVPGRVDGGLPKLFIYLRYSADLSRTGLDHLGLPAVEPENVQRLDSIEHIEELLQVGRATARRVLPQHFEGFLQNRGPSRGPVTRAP